ncbi:putative flavonol synthase 6 [Nymphaea thermarum]|nr:putative flavonol synthase 6 [Nymphaea thermarum]
MEQITTGTRNSTTVQGKAADQAAAGSKGMTTNRGLLRQQQWTQWNRNVTRELSKSILRGTALALGGCSPYTFEGERAGDTFWAMQLLSYPGSTEKMVEDGVGWQVNHKNCQAYIVCFLSSPFSLVINVSFCFPVSTNPVEHTLTMAMNRCGEWIWALPVPGTFVCNLGDMLKAYSNGIYESAFHRVINNSPNDRISIPFFYEKGHGIPESMCQRVRDVARRFFGLSDEEKLKIKLSPSTGFRGYQTIGENLTGGRPDKQEAIDIYKVVEPGTYGAVGAALEGPNLWPENPADFRPLIEEYVKLSKNILRGIALALGGSPNTFEGERAGDTFWTMRILSYPGSTEKMVEDGVGCVINQDDDIPALQAMNRCGEWIWALPVPGTFVCNLGDMSKAYSNGIYESAFHRVINNSPNDRISIPFFYETNFDAVVEPLDFCMEKTGGFAKFEPKMFGEYLLRKLHATFGIKTQSADLLVLKGHGIPKSMCERVRDVARSFVGLPDEEKLKIKLSPSTGFRGYQTIGENLTGGRPDKHGTVDALRFSYLARFTSLTIYLSVCLSLSLSVSMRTPVFNRFTRIWKPVVMEPLVLPWKDQTCEFSKNILQGIALALGGSPFAFERGRSEDTFWIMRLLSYPGFTEKMLENGVMNRCGEWIWALPLPGTFVCNIGDMLKAYSNGIYESTFHRVINNRPNYIGFRYNCSLRLVLLRIFSASIQVLCVGNICLKLNHVCPQGATNFNIVVEPLDFCKEKTGGVAKFEPKMYGEYLKGHGIPESMCKRVRDVARSFFGLPDEEKLKIKLSPSTGFRGYQTIGENLTGGRPDKHEAIDIYKVVEPGTYGAVGAAVEGPNLWPENPADFRPLLEEYISAHWVVHHTPLKVKELETLSGRCGYLVIPAVLRKLWKMALDGLLTVINQDDDIPALQAMNRCGEWIWALPVPGTFVCNLGDMSKAYSNGIYESAFHRVINNSPNDRISIPFFYETNFDAVVEPLDFCKEKTGGVAKFEPKMYGEYLVRKMHATFGMKTKSSTAITASLRRLAMATDFGSIPIIDVGPLLEKCEDPRMGEDAGVLEVVRQLDKAGREDGIFYVKGHGIPESMCKRARDVARSFFGLPDEEKLKIKLSPSTGFRGYHTMRETLAGGRPDKHEFIDARESCRFQIINRGVYKCELSKNILRGIALALGGSPYSFEGERAGDSSWAMQLIRYPGSTEKMVEDGVGGLGLLTVVNQDDDIPAFQAMNRCGEWMWALPVPGTFLCNIGDMLKAYSNGIYESVIHKVGNNSPNDRVAIPFFYETNFGAVVEPLDFCKEKTGGVAKFEPKMYGEYLVRKMHATYGMKH